MYPRLPPGPSNPPKRCSPKTVPDETVPDETAPDENIPPEAFLLQVAAVKGLAGSPCVVDASVAAKWFLPGEEEPHTKEALDLLRRYVSGELEFLVPDLFWPEIGNIFWKSAVRGRWTIQAAEEAFAAVRGLRVPTAPNRDLLEATMRIANGTGRTFYDSLYIAVAVQSGGKLITADQRLANAIGSSFPVVWLGLL